MRSQHDLLALIVVITMAACAPQSPSTSTPLPTTAPTDSVPTSTSQPTQPQVAPSATSIKKVFVPGPVFVKPPRDGFGYVVTFAPEPDPALATRSFPEGIKKIYAMWDYSGMRAGQVIRRDWFVDGRLWLSREEPWDFATYGASGTIRDIFIQDQQVGLPSGHWQLEIAIDGVDQFPDPDDLAGRSFSIGKLPGVTWGTGGLVTSPDGKLGALIDPDKVSIVDEQGVVKTLVETNTLGVSWMPDSQNLVYSSVTRTSLLTFRLEIYLVMENVVTGEQIILMEPPYFPHYPIVSPDGRYITIYHNGYYGDGEGGEVTCNVDKRRAFFLELDPVTHQAIGDIQWGNFSDLPADSEGAVMVSSPDFQWPGVWTGPSTFKIALQFRCGRPEQDGIYLVDVDAETLTRIGSLY